MIPSQVSPRNGPVLWYGEGGPINTFPSPEKFYKDPRANAKYLSAFTVVGGMVWTTQDPRFHMALRLVLRWVAKHPELEDRLERAVFLIEQVKKTADPNVYVVGSATKAGLRYFVKVNRHLRVSSCTCPDHANGNHCKHRLAAALYEKSIEFSRYRRA